MRLDAAENGRAVEVVFEASAELLAKAEAELWPALNFHREPFAIDPGTVRAEISDDFGCDADAT